MRQLDVDVALPGNRSCVFDQLLARATKNQSKMLQALVLRHHGRNSITRITGLSFASLLAYQ